MGCSLSTGSRLMGTAEPPPSRRPRWTIKWKYPDGDKIQGLFSGNNHRGQDAGLGEDDSLMHRKDNRFAWQENKANYTLRPEAHNILIRTSLIAFDNTLRGSSKTCPRVLWSSMALKGNAGFMEQYFKSFHLKQMKNILKYEDSQLLLQL